MGHLGALHSRASSLSGKKSAGWNSTATVVAEKQLLHHRGDFRWILACGQICLLFFHLYSTYCSSFFSALIPGHQFGSVAEYLMVIVSTMLAVSVFQRQTRTSHRIASHVNRKVLKGAMESMCTCQTLRLGQPNWSPSPEMFSDTV